MSKSAITRLFVIGTVAVVVGVVLDVIAFLLTFAGGVLVIGGPNVIQFNGGSAAWLVVGLIVAGTLVVAAGALAGLVAWIGALLNTAQLEDKTWFVVLLVLGLVSFGFIAMIAYVLAGPDGSKSLGSTRQGTAQADVATAARG